MGIAWVFPKELILGAGASIGNLTVVKGLDMLSLADHASIGRLNWITAYPSGLPPHFAHLASRSPSLVLGEHAAVTNRHIIDCTERVVIGRYATVAGFRSQILTHSIDLRACRQDANPVAIGEYCFVGTACTILGGSKLPDYSVLGAHALLNRAFDEPFKLYAGVPAKAVAALERDTGYFKRSVGFIA
jgi:acetyltransferase-like isoleucine patch superfamily enzyme